LDKFFVQIENFFQKIPTAQNLGRSHLPTTTLLAKSSQLRPVYYQLQLSLLFAELAIWGDRLPKKSARRRSVIFGRRIDANVRL